MDLATGQPTCRTEYSSLTVIERSVEITVADWIPTLAGTVATDDAEAIFSLFPASETPGRVPQGHQTLEALPLLATTGCVHPEVLDRQSLHNFAAFRP